MKRQPLPLYERFGLFISLPFLERKQARMSKYFLNFQNKLYIHHKKKYLLFCVDILGLKINRYYFLFIYCVYVFLFLKVISIPVVICEISQRRQFKTITCSTFISVSFFVSQIWADVSSLTPSVPSHLQHAPHRKVFSCNIHNSPSVRP